MQQASRRSWHIGQTRPVKVVFMAYRNTLQANALKLVAKNLQSSLAVEGELPEDGLAAYGDEEDETVEAVFAQARDAEPSAGEYRVDDGWKPVAIDRDGHHANGNGNGHAAVAVNGHHDEAQEPQQSLFS